MTSSRPSTGEFPRRGTPTPGPRPSSPTPTTAGALTNGDLSTPMELNDFMSELGVVMQLPKRPTTRAMPAIDAVAPLPPVRRSGRAVVLPAIAVLLGIVTLVQRLPVSAPPAPLPPLLHGEWQSTHQDYQSRRLSFTSTHLGIALAPDAPPTLHRVREVQATTLHDTTRIQLQYEQDGALVPFQLQLVTQPRPLLVLKHPTDVIWERVPAPVPGAGDPSPSRVGAPPSTGDIAANPTGLTTRPER